MDKRSYYLVIAISFVLLLIHGGVFFLSGIRVPILYGILLRVGPFIPLLAAIYQIGYSPNIVLRGIGWFNCMIVLLGTLLMILHWPFSKQLMLAGGLPMAALMLVATVWKRKANLLEYLLVAYVALRVLDVFLAFPRLVRGIELLLVGAIVVIGISYILRMPKEEEGTAGDF